MDGLAVVLVEPQDPLNIGSVVRAARNCGVRDVRLVRPADFDRHRVGITAPNSDAWVEAHVRIFDDYDAAFDGIERLVAFSARAREERQQRLRFDGVLDAMGADHRPTGLVFGREDHGLPNEAVRRCDILVMLETSEDYTSLNLAQAVMIALHRAFLRFGDAVPMPGPARAFPPAERGQVERMMGTTERALEAIEFFKGDQRENVLRTLQRIWLNADVDTQELATLWGIFSEIERRHGGGQNID